MIELLDISIHAPLAGCDREGRRGRRGGKISIHAPLAGCDLASVINAGITTYFNPRTPCGVRLLNRNKRYKSIGISIHAPLAGCDSLKVKITQKEMIFQSTHPLRGATSPAFCFAASKAISIHAPLAGCDILYSILRVVVKISIHAPLAGCDSVPCAALSIPDNFNPRTPCGVRPDQ